MWSKLKYLFFLCLFFIACVQQSDPQKQSQILFNGKDFSNWTEPENNVWWKIKNGVLSARNDSTRQGSVLWTAKAYTDFVLELDFKMGDGIVDSGVFLRTEHEQIQIGISGSLKRDMTCSPYISGKGYPVEAENIANLLKQKGWNHLRIKALGAAYMVWLNGEKVMHYISETAEKKGAIGLQLHPNREMEVYFRNIKLMEIPVGA